MCVTLGKMVGRLGSSENMLRFEVPSYESMNVEIMWGGMRL